MSGVIALEGPDGSGKSTTWNRLKNDSRFADVVFTREPSRDTWYGDAVYRSMGDDDADSLAELYLYMADHANHLSEVVRPALESGKWVVTDRYLGSRCVYQAVTLSENDVFGSVEDALEYVFEMHQSVSEFPVSTLYMEVSPEVSVERSEQANKFERVEHLQRVVDGYSVLEDRVNYPYHHINTETQTEDEVYNQAAEMIRDIMHSEDR